MKFTTFLNFFKIILLGTVTIFFISCKQSMEGMVIVTQVPEIRNSDDSGASSRLLRNSQIIALDISSKGNQKLLSGDFNSACSPVISFDGKMLLFSAIQKDGDKWQIWEMDLGNLKTRQVAGIDGNCIDPAYLPNGRIVFSKATEINGSQQSYPVYTCKSDGSDMRQISFNPHDNFATTVLKDGRLLTISNSVFPSRGDKSFMVLRPDGTKAELFYKGASGSSVLSRAIQTPDGKLMFIEADKGSYDGGSLVSISYNRPLHSHNILSSGVDGIFRAVALNKDGKCLVALKPSGNDKYGLYGFDPATREIVEIYKSEEFNVVDVVLVGQNELPKKLPSEVDPGSKTGLLLCQDINFSGMQSNLQHPATMIRVIGIDSALGIVPVEKDGSFYLKVKADTPFQIQSLDADGNVLNGTCDWIYLRPNERRGCSGCHEDNEMVPENRYCLSVSKDPAEIPSHVRNIQEKKIELE